MTTYSKTLALLNTGFGSWTIPHDMNWNSFQISCLGAGAMGGGAWASTTNGTYSFVNGYGPGAIIPIFVGYVSGNTIYQSGFGSIIPSSSMVFADCGVFGSIGNNGGKAINSIGMIKYDGGNAGLEGSWGQGGGGAAAGPHGPGGSGGNGATDLSQYSSGGGGGSDGGTNAQDASYSHLSLGGTSVYGANGGDGGYNIGAYNGFVGFSGLPGHEFTLSNGYVIGCGSGGGGGWNPPYAYDGPAGLYGAGGGGDGNMMNSTGTGGSQGFILIQYNVGSMSSAVMMGC